MYATIGDQCLIKIKTWSEYIIPYKTEFATDVTDVQMLLILIMNKNVTLHPNSSYDQMCISKRQNSDIIIIHIMRQPKTGFLILKRYHSLEHAETKKYISI